MGFAENIKKIREDKNINEEAMTKALSCSLQRLAVLEKGHEEPSISELMAAAQFLGVTTDQLLGQVQDKVSEKPFNPLSALAGMSLPGGFSLDATEGDADIDEELALELAEMVAAIDSRRHRNQGESS